VAHLSLGHLDIQPGGQLLCLGHLKSPTTVRQEAHWVPPPAIAGYQLRDQRVRTLRENVVGVVGTGQVAHLAQRLLGCRKHVLSSH
jgi:hypothetical protein